MRGGFHVDTTSLVTEDLVDSTTESDNIDLYRYDPEDEQEDEDDQNDFSFQDYVQTIAVRTPEEFERLDLKLDLGGKQHLILPGTILELRDQSGRTSQNPISGDFLLVRAVVEETMTGKISLRGFLLRRCAYLQPQFNRRLNDLFMLIEVGRNAPRPRFIQGLKNIAPDDVIKIRRCVFTELDYELKNFRTENSHVPARLKTQLECMNWLFHNGSLICRWVHIVELEASGKAYGGETRKLYKREVADFSAQIPWLKSLQDQPFLGSFNHTTKPKKERDIKNSSLRNNHNRSQPIEEIRDHAPRCFQPPTRKSRIQDIGDGYSGIGGVSKGAEMAGMMPKWALEKDEHAMAAYRKNFPNAMHLQMDAHDFPALARRCVHGCDHIHMSCPCPFWSQNHTIAGRNDEANMLTLYTVEAWLGALKSGTFSLEQAPGLITMEKHRSHWRLLLNGILNRGYRVRWRVLDMAWYGEAQHRRRLIVVGAKAGCPLPPFPAAQYGPPGTGLRRYRTVADALQTLESLGHEFSNDPYHQVGSIKPAKSQPYDPHVHLARTITCNGGNNAHYSGERPFSVRELSQLQGLPEDMQFSGSLSEGRKQCGNVWPAISNSKFFLVWAATREAFELGLIDADDEILDLRDFLEAKGFQFPDNASIEVESYPPAPKESPYRYLHRIEKTVKPRSLLQLWGKSKAIDPLPQQRQDQRLGNLNKRVRAMSLIQSCSDLDEPSPSLSTSPPRRKRQKKQKKIRKRTVHEFPDEIIVITDEESS